MRATMKSVISMLVLAILATSVVVAIPQAGLGLPNPAPGPPAVKGLEGTPFTQEIQVSIPAGDLNSNGTAITVPANQILMIEFISVNVQTEAGTAQNTLFALNTSLNGNTHSHRLHMVRQAFISGGEIFVAGQNVTIYADGGTAVNANIGRDGNTGFAVTATVTVTGRLFDQ